jgi:hypothetical protein
MPWELDGNSNIGGNRFLGTRQNDPLSIRTRANVNNNSVVHITPAPDANTLGNVGIGTTQPRQRLALGSGNVLLPNANLGIDGNLYFGGITDAGQTGMRLFGGLVNNAIPAGFVDVRTTNPSDGLRIRVDTGDGGTERMRVTASGNVGIGTGDPIRQLQISSRGSDQPDVEGIGLEHTSGSPDAAYIRFGDNTGWKLHFARSREGSVVAGFGPNFGPTGILMTIQDNGNVEVTGDISLTGADCAEYFNVVDSVQVEPGMPLVASQEDTLRPCEKAYDKKVVGVVSGAGDLRPGILLNKEGSQDDGLPLAVTGKVNCRVDAQYSPIEVGDLLTTSPTLGHAMKALDPVKAFGAVLGKALKPLKEGTGLIPVMVALQ